MVDGLGSTVDETASKDGPIDIDLVRGWEERRDPALRADHCVPALARLVPHDTHHHAFEIHGPEVYVGRFHPQHGPVDLVPTGFLDHEIYKMSAPHIRLTRSKSGRWKMRPLSPSAVTRHNGTRLRDTGHDVSLEDGDEVTLGVVDFTFELTDVTHETWLSAKKDLLLAVEGPSLFLKRAGSVCGPCVEFHLDDGCLVGRSFPHSHEVPGESWDEFDQPDWDLAGLYDHERKFVGFRHVRFEAREDEWTVRPLTPRQRTYVNRIEISGATPLMPGDEIGLGPVLFHFHHPSDIHASTQRQTAELPTVVDWEEEHTGTDVEPVDPEGETEAVDESDEVGDE